ncbi:MAG: hypothetical protein R6V06_00315 [Kiritimatiellia bacterium]
MLKKSLSFILLLSTAGCVMFGFKTERASRFVDVDNNLLYVEYSTEQRTESLPNGAELNYDRKVRITLPDGRKKVFYQTLSRVGVRYHTPDDRYVFVECGPWCQLIKGGKVVYRGLFQKNCTLD